MTSDNEKNSAVEKVVDAFRQRRAEGAEPAESTGATESSAAEATDETRVVKVEAGQRPVVDATTEVIESVGDDSTMEINIDAAEADTVAMTVVTQSTTEFEPAVVIVRDSAAAVAAADAPPTMTTEGGVVHEQVVAIAGTGDPVQTPARRKVETVDPDSLDRREIVEESVVTVAPTTSPADSTPTEVIEAQTQEIAAQTQEIVTPTEEIAVRTTAIDSAAAKTAAAAAGAAAAGEWTSAPHQPKVIPGAEPAAAKSRKGGRFAWILLALLVLAAVAALLWYFLVHNSPQNRAAAAAKQYQNAMSEGDLATLREVTCGEDYAFYSSVSDAEFAKATAAQRERNQMMSFKEITGVQVDGDTARVGVDVFNTADENATTNAQVTLHKIDGKWKVCTKP